MYLNYIINDDTAIGYFQYLLLYLMGDQFYLYWHGLYNDELIICNDKALEKVVKNVLDFGVVNGKSLIEFPDEVVHHAKLIDFRPRIKFKRNSVEIRVVTFSKWKGFVEKVYSINRSQPNVITNIESNMLVEFKCGIKF